MKMISEDRFFIYDKPQKKSLKRYISFIINRFTNLIYKQKMNLFHPRKNIQKKYNVSICAIFKNEGKYLREWIEFHKIIGVDHFYLYNNNSNDGYEKVLKPYIEKNEVTLINWTKNQAQMEAYNDCIINYKEETKWIGFIDIDEFVNPISKDNIYEFLKPFEKNRGSVLIYWKIFGTSGLMNRENGLVCKDFTICWPKHDSVGKCFYNTKYDFNINKGKKQFIHHDLWTSFHGLSIPPVNSFNKVVRDSWHCAKKEFDVQINHYFTKSYSEYLEKKSKGDVYFKINPHDEEYFYEHETKCTSSDVSIYKYIIKLEKVLQDGVMNGEK